MKTVKGASSRTWLVLLLALSAVSLAVAVQRNSIKARQTTLYRAEASLLAALNDPQHSHVAGAGATRKYGYFDVFPCNIRFVVNKATYHCVFMTQPEYQFENHGTLAITPQRGFVWLDDRTGPKVISTGYQVPRWRGGF